MQTDKWLTLVSLDKKSSPWWPHFNNELIISFFRWKNYQFTPINPPLVSANCNKKNPNYFYICDLKESSTYRRRRRQHRPPWWRSWGRLPRPPRWPRCWGPSGPGATPRCCPLASCRQHRSSPPPQSFWQNNNKIIYKIYEYYSVLCYTDKKGKLNCPHILGNSDGSGCKVIYD